MFENYLTQAEVLAEFACSPRSIKSTLCSNPQRLSATTATGSTDRSAFQTRPLGQRVEFKIPPFTL